MRLLLPTNLPLVEESFLSSPFSRLLPELQLSSFQQSEQEGKSEGLQIISISLAPLFSLLLSSLPDFSTGSGGEAGASVIHCRALRCRRLDVNHTGNPGNC